MKIEIAPGLDHAAALEALAAEVAAGLATDRPHAMVRGVRLDQAPGESDDDFMRRARLAAGTDGFAIFVTPTA
jgi:hypothetical protein